MKTQMKFQRYLCLSLVILGAVTIVYALLFKTGMIAALGTLTDKQTNPTLYYEQAQIFYDCDSFNTVLFWLGIVALLAAVLLYVFANHKRRNYYITNYIVSIFVAVVHFAIAIVTVVFSSIYYGQCLDIKKDTVFMESWKADSEGIFRSTYTYSTNTGMFIFGYIVCFLLVAGAVFLILNMLWKRKLMRGEKKLLEESFAEEVA